ncbi:MAG: DegV family protein [Candidatus Humimicrobiia bacterium]
MADTIKIVTDSTADLTSEICKKFDIGVVPYYLNYKGKSYKDRLDMKINEYYERLKKMEIPTTSIPSIGDVLQIYNKVAKKNVKILSLHVSSKLSGFLNAVNTAKDMFKNAEVHLFDSLTTSGGLALQVIAAAKMAKEGKSIKNILNRLKIIRDRMETFAILNTLEYLKRGGRIGKVESFLGSVLNIKPIIKVIDGELEPFSRARSISKAMDKVLENIKEKIKENTQIEVAIMHTNALERAKELKRKILEKFNCREIITLLAGAAIATHVGPGGVGISYYPVNEEDEEVK